MADEEEVRWLFERLYKITSEQDKIQLQIRAAIDDMEDPRWQAVLMLDYANAIILGISRNKGNPYQIVVEGYVEEKIGSLNDRWFSLRWRARR